MLLGGFAFLLIASSGCMALGTATTETSTALVPASSKTSYQTVLPGDTIAISYVGFLTDGTVFSRTNEGEPVSFVVGSGKMIRGVEEAVVGMKLNERKRISIPKADAYGERRQELVRQFARSQFPVDVDPKPGMIIRLHDEQGKAIAGIIVDVKDDTVLVDLNHPLAGKDLQFDITIVSIG